MTNNTVLPLEPLWDAQGVAAFLNVSVSFVYKASADGRLPCCRIGALVRFDPAAIRRWATGAGAAEHRKPVTR